MAADNKVVLALEDVTLHVKSGQVKGQFGDSEIVDGVSLKAGDTVSHKNLASYQQEAIADGTLTGVEVLSPADAAKKTKEIEERRAYFAQLANQNVVHAHTLAGPDADDGSHSDHEVTPEDRRAAHAAAGAAAAAEDVASESADSGGSKDKSK